MLDENLKVVKLTSHKFTVQSPCVEGIESPRLERIGIQIYGQNDRGIIMHIKFQFVSNRVGVKKAFRIPDMIYFFVFTCSAAVSLI